MEARLLSAAAVCLLISGCVTTQSWFCEPSAPAVSEVNAIWEGRLLVTQDTVNGGRPLPGLAGRLYLFAMDQGTPLKCNGTVRVDVYDTTHCQPGAAPPIVGRFEFDQVSLAKLLRKDKIGWGYTLFLPWPDYRPEIAHVRLNVCYMPVNGSPLYAEPASIALNNQANLVQTRQVTKK